MTMRVLFIWPAVRGADLRNFLPLGFGQLAAHLPADVEAELYDGVLTSSCTLDDVTSAVVRFQPQIVGLSLWNFNHPEVVAIAKMVRQRFPQIITVIGGPSVTGYGERVLAVVPGDFAIVGEGETAFATLVEAVRHGCAHPRGQNPRLTAIPGLIWRDEAGQTHANDPRREDLAAIAPADPRFIRLDEYLRMGYDYGIHPVGRPRRTAPIWTTRGCPYSCRYCTGGLHFGSKVRTRPAAAVVAEIARLHREHRINGFNIIDDNFTFHLDYAKEVCRGILALGLRDVSFCCPNGVRLERLDAELLALMRQAGWAWLFLAPESGSTRTLQRMHKHLDLAVAREKIRLVKAAGLQAFGFFMIGYPGETPADLRRTMRFAAAEPFDAVVFTCFQPLVGTPVFADLVAAGDLVDAAIGHDYYTVTYAPRGMTVAQLRAWRLLAFAWFFARRPQRLATLFASFSWTRLLAVLRKFL